MTARQRSILAVALVTQGISVGLVYAVPPVFLEALEETFDATRTQIAAGPILIMLGLTAGSLSAGAALDRGYGRRVVLGGALLLCAGLLVASAASNLWLLGLASIALGFAVPSVGPLAGASLVTRAFDEGRGRALGLMSMGPPLGSGLFAALAGWSLLEIGLRESFLLFAAIAFLAIVPLAWLVVPVRFERKKADEANASGVSMGDVLRMPVFWWTAGVFALSAGVATGWTAHAGAYFGGVGFGDGERAGVLAAQFWMGVPGAFAFGFLADRFSVTNLFVLLLFSEALVYGLFALSPSPSVAAGLAIAFGFLVGGMIPLYMVLLGRRMGADALGRAMGLSNLVMLPLMSLAVMIAAADFERAGHYSVSLAVFSVCLIAAIVCVLGSERSARSR
ncbi:MAG: hypothetical protein CL908_21935 [Deltaproteobacteria bacterium]|nr:hypothetical protein [Deltaproteobacteria bacterium]